MDARIRFYEITRCGYYKKKNHCFGTIREVLNNLQEWISGKPLNETQTYSVDPEGDDDSNLSTYCYSLIQKNSDYLLTTWNENPNVNGMIASVNVLGLTGEAQIETKKVSEGFVSGYPSYFWFIPEKRLLATVQFSGIRLNGKKSLDRYINGFLEKNARFVVHEDNDDEHTILGYGTANDYSLDNIPRFAAELCKQPGQINYILRNRAFIRKIIKKDRLIYQRLERKDWWQSVFRFVLGKDIGENCTTENKINLEIDYRPSQDELKAMIDTWSQHPRKDTFFNIGFKMENDQVYWLKETLASDVFDLDVRLEDNGVLINPDTLLNNLQQRQDVIFRKVFNENSSSGN